MYLRKRVLYLGVIFSFFIANNVVSAQSTCGNGILEDGEQCEGSNTTKCNACIIVAPYMCQNARRTVANSIGVQTEWQNNVSAVGGRQLVLLLGNGSLPIAEQCQEMDMGIVGELYSPLVETTVAKDFFYTISTCQFFPADTYFEFRDSCVQTPIDECVAGLSECDNNAFCIEPENGIGYSCECDPNYFVGKHLGSLCYESGVEIIINITANVADISNRGMMVVLRRNIMQMLMNESYIHTGSCYPDVDIALLEEGVKGYVVDEDTVVLTNGIFTGRKIWRIVIRVATKYVNLQLISKALIFNDYDVFSANLALLDNYNTPGNNPQYIVHSVNQCSNDRSRPCTGDSNCINGGVCTTKPDFSVKVMTSGGSTEPLAVSTSSSSILSVTYDASEEMLNVRVRYSTIDDKVIDILYIPNVVSPLTALESATFNSDEFPCLPLGTGSIVQDQENTVCCLNRFEDRYTTVLDFGTFVTGSVFTSEIALQQSCLLPNTPPLNNSIDILQSPTDFTTGTFKNMPRSKSVIDATKTNGYKDVNLFLAVEDIQTKGAIVTQIPMGKSLRFFIGMVHIRGMKSDRISVAHSQSVLTVDITESYFFSTSSPTTSSGSFIQDVSVVLREINDCCSENTTKFATVTVIVPSTVSANDPNTVISLSSIVVGTGFFRTEQSGKMYPCMSFYSGANKENIDSTIDKNSWCGLRDPMCVALSYGTSAIGPGGTVTFTIPLPDTIWNKNEIIEDDLQITESVFIDFMIVVTNNDDNSVLMTTLQTQTKLTATSIISMCTETQVVAGIGDIMNIDIFLGLAGNENEFETGLLKSLNFSTTSAALVRDVSTKESNVMTLLFKGSETVFEKEFASGYTLAVEDMATLHIINLGKLDEVQTLINSGGAYTVEPNTDPRLGTISKLIASPALLKLCPYQTIKNNFGCISRREITQRRIDFTQNSIVPLTARGNSDEDKESVHKRTGLWTQNLLGGSQFAKELGYNHSKLMQQKNNLNSRYRNGFMVAPTVPWSKAQLENAEIKSILDLAQNTITTMLLSYDKNVGIVYDPVVELVMSMNIAASEADIIANQQAIAAKFAEGADIDPASVTIDVSTILALQSDIRRRRLLESDTSPLSSFNLRITFQGSDVKKTLELASEFKTSVEDINSLQSNNIITTINTLMTETVPSFSAVKTLVDSAKTTQPPREISKCFDDEKWEIDVTNLLKLDIGNSNTNSPKVGFVSCKKRSIRMGQSNDIVNNIDMRGPRKVDDWLSIPRDHVLDTTQWMYGWEWWDFCADAPKNAGYNPEFEIAWQTIRQEASQKCCLCNAMPKNHATSSIYKHAYSWPLILQDSVIHDIYTRLSYPLHSPELDSTKYKINPQIRNFRIDRGANMMLFDTKTAYGGNFMPPLAWDIDDMGRTVLPSCGPGQWLSGLDWCELCPMNSYKMGDRIELAQKDQIYERGGRRNMCPLNTVSFSGSTSVQECLCDKGFFKNTDQICIMCPAGTFKDTISSVDSCIACKNGYRAKRGSTSIADCVDMEISDTYSLYKSNLGLLQYQTNVEPNWISTPVYDQDQERLCTLLDDRSTLDCGGRSVYTTPDIKAFFENQINHDKISILQRPGYMGPSPPGFSEQMTLVKKWVPGTVFTTNLRLQMKSIDFSQVHAGEDVYLVNFISSKKLDVDDSSVDWNWILCGKKLPGIATSTYSFCANEEDPDNSGVRNYENKHILDGNIVLLNGEGCCESCYYDNKWMADCLEKSNNPDKHSMYDNTLSWTPFTHKPVPPENQDLWVYNIFVVGESEACTKYNCDENIVLMNLRQHIKTQVYPSKDITIDFLPGNVFSYTIPSPHTVLNLITSGSQVNYANAINGIGYVKNINIPQSWKPGMSIEITPSIVLEKLKEEAGNNLRMNVFMTSKLLTTEESDWITCGSKKHIINAISTTSISTVSTQQTLACFFTDTIVHKKLGINDFNIDKFATMFMTSNNAWKSSGGFLPDPPLCAKSSKSCKPGQIEFPGPDNVAIVSGYSRCDLKTSLDRQNLPCMYTVGDIANKYMISQQDIDAVRDGSMLSMYESDTGHEQNVRAVHADKFTKKIAYGSISNPSVSDMLYLCHTQYNNLPDNVLDKKSLRPNIACAISNDMDLTSVRDCVCGIVARVYKKSPDTLAHYNEKIVRIIPQTLEENLDKSQIPANVFLTELKQTAISIADVLSVGVTESIEDSVQFYSASNPVDMKYEVSVPISNIQFAYDMCENKVDPDNTFATNRRNPHILDGIVVPFGKIYNTAPMHDSSCCNMFHNYQNDLDADKYCPDRCETNGPYELKAGTVRWTPEIFITGDYKQEYWLYVTYSIGDSIACKNLGCDEEQEQIQLSRGAYATKPFHKNDFWHNTVVNVQIPIHDKLVTTASRNILSLKTTEKPNQTSTQRSSRHYVHDTKSIHHSVSKTTDNNHIVYNARATKNIHMKELGSPQKMIANPISTQNRMLLAIESPKNAPGDEQSNTCSKKISSLNNNNQVIAIVCKDPFLCDMLSIDRTVPVADFCSGEDDFMSKYLPKIRNEIITASAGAISEIYMTSVVSPGAYAVCANSQTRKLLQTETVRVTIIVEGSAVYVIDNTILDEFGNINLTKVSGISNLTLVRCNSPAGCVDARRMIGTAFNFTDPPLIPQIPQSSPTQDVFVINTVPEATSDWLILPIAIILAVVCIAVIGVCYYNSRRRNTQSEDGNSNETARMIDPNTQGTTEVGGGSSAFPFNQPISQRQIYHHPRPFYN